jgi:hypothetical protein
VAPMKNFFCVKGDKKSFVAALAILFIAGCTAGSPSVPSTNPARSTDPYGSVSPSPLASTATQENALASKIPLDGNKYAPLHWRLPAKIEAEDAPALLAARRTTALDSLLFSFENPSVWAPALYAVEKNPFEETYAKVSTRKTHPWSERIVGPVWIWVMKIQRNSPRTVTVHQCMDQGWSGAVRRSINHFEPGAGRLFETTVSLLDYPDGKRWKTTGYEIVGDKSSDSHLFSRCKTWAATHTTTEGWTLPPEPTATP